MADKEIFKILKSALDADENGDEKKAIELYSEAVELYLKLTDPTLRGRLHEYVVKAINRAEELRGIRSPPKPQTSPSVDEGHASHQRVQSNFFVHF